MSYVDRIKQPGETIIAVGRMHWVVFVPSVVGLVVGMLLLALSPAFANGSSFIQVVLIIVAAVIGLLAVFDILRTLVEVWTTEIAVTDRRVIHKRGLIRRETGEMNMNKVESVVVDQSILGRVLGYGSILVRGTGAGIEGLHHIANPLALRTAIAAR